MKALLVIPMFGLCVVACSSTTKRVVSTRPLGTPQSYNVPVPGSGPSTFASRNFGPIGGSLKGSYGSHSGMEMQVRPRRSIFSDDPSASPVDDVKIRIKHPMIPNAGTTKKLPSENTWKLFSTHW
jgi:hypothetical protein